MCLHLPTGKISLRNTLMVCVDDLMSCSLVCKCAVLIGCWERMEGQTVFLRRTSPDAKHGHRRKAHSVSDAGDLVVNLPGGRPWGGQRLHELLDELGAASVTLAGAGLHDVLLGAAIAANALGVPTTVIADAVAGQPMANLPPCQSHDLLLSLLEPFASLMPSKSIASVMDTTT